jgi:hypothetical protein
MRKINSMKLIVLCLLHIFNLNMSADDLSSDWSVMGNSMDAVTATCQKFLSQLPPDQWKKLLSLYLENAASPISSHVRHESRATNKSTATKTPPEKSRSSSTSRKRRKMQPAGGNDADTEEDLPTPPKFAHDSSSQRFST